MTGQTKQGFSLLELLIVLAVVGVLVAMGGLFWSSFLADRQLNEAARVFETSLRKVSEQAVTQSQALRLEVSSERLSWFDVNDSLLGQTTLPKGAGISLQDPGGSIRFSGRGLPETGFRFELRRAQESKTVYLLPTGAVIIR